MSTPLFRKTVMAGSAGLVHAAGTFLSGIIVARLLGPEGAGIVSLAAWIAIMASTIGSLGLTQALQRYLPELNARNEAQHADGLKLYFLYFTLSSTVVVSLGLASLWLFAWRPVDGVTWSLIIGCVIATILGDFFLNYWQALQRYAHLAVLQAISAAIRLVSVVIGSLTLGTSGALLAYILSYVIPVVMCLGMFRGSFTPVPKELGRQALRFSAYAWLVVIIYNFVWTRAEILFIGAAMGAESVGLYAAGLGLANLTNLLPVLLSAALLPHLSQQRGNGAGEEMASVYKNMLVMMTLLTLPICLGAAAISPVLLPLIFGESFRGGVPSGMILISTSAVGIIAVSSKSLLFSLDRGRILLFTNLVGVALIVLAGLLIIPTYELVGAAWARGASHAVVVGIQLAYLWRLGFSFPTVLIVRIFAAAAICAGVAYAFVETIGGAVSLFVAIPAGALVYILALRGFRVIDMMDPQALERAATQAPFGLKHVVTLGISVLSSGTPARHTPAE